VVKSRIRGNIHHPPHTFSWHGAQAVKRRDKFTFITVKITEIQRGIISYVSSPCIPLPISISFQLIYFKTGEKNYTFSFQISGAATYGST
jgi:hypothetical protein